MMKFYKKICSEASHWSDLYSLNYREGELELEATATFQSLYTVKVENYDRLYYIDVAEDILA